MFKHRSIYGLCFSSVVNIATFEKNITLGVSDIILIILSSAGLLHGVLFAFYLITIKKKKGISNVLLGLILVFMAFRIGKSVMLYFGDDLEPIFIFIGLAFLLLIGPLLRWYVRSMTVVNFKLSMYHIIEFVPFIIFFVASLFVTKEWYENSKWVIIIFSVGLIFIYLHFAFHILLSWRSFKLKKRAFKNEIQTKSQQHIFSWLQLLLIGSLAIWITYVLNILDETVPYIVGPIMYSIVIYYLSFKAYQLKVADLDGNVFKPNINKNLFNEISHLILEDKLYLESDMSLLKLSRLLGKSSQQISSVINQYAKRNFNDYINYYRIQDAKTILQNTESEKYTISSIAFDVGFNSLSAFNSAFKKFEGTTPSTFRKN